MEVKTGKTIRRSEDSTALELSQLQDVVSSHDLALGDPNQVKAVEDCFDLKNVDGGVVVFYKEF